jgi:hypothetical protein
LWCFGRVLELEGKGEEEAAVWVIPGGMEVDYPIRGGVLGAREWVVWVWEYDHSLEL